MIKKSSHESSSLYREDVRLQIEQTLLRLLEPLAFFVREAGLSTSDLCKLYENAAVKLEIDPARSNKNSSNISEISATTGISRSKVAGILAGLGTQKNLPLTKSRQPLARILRAWLGSVAFKNKNGEPANLNLYGKRASFDLLVKKNGAGISTRAALEAMLKAKVVIVNKGDVISLNTTNLCKVDCSGGGLQALAERLSDVMYSSVESTLNARESRFFSREYQISASTSQACHIREDLLANGFDLTFDEKKNTDESCSDEGQLAQILLTIFCHERAAITDAVRDSKKARLNYKRKT